MVLIRVLIIVGISLVAILPRIICGEGSGITAISTSTPFVKIGSKN